MDEWTTLPPGRAARTLAAATLALLALLTALAGAAEARPAPVASIGRAVVDGDILAPHAVVATPDGTIYAAEFGVYVAAAGTPARRNVWKYTPTGAGGYTKTRVAGTADGAACGDGQPGSSCGDGGPATSARLGRMSGLAVDAAGRIYLAESFWQRVRVISASGTIRTVEGAPGGLNVPEGLAYDASTDSVLVTDKRNNRLLSFPATDGGAVGWSTVAGTGTQCPVPTASCGDGGPASAAQLRLPGAVAADGRGTIYLADSGAYRVRRIVRGGAITAFAGNGTTCPRGAACGDGGPAAAASFGDPLTDGADGEGPFGVATMPDGTVYIADSDIDRMRRVLPDGTIETVATLRHPKAPFALRTATGHDLVVPEWNGRAVVRLTGVDRDDPPPPPQPLPPPATPAPVAPPPPPAPVRPGSRALRLGTSVVGSRTLRLGRPVRLRFELSAPARLTLEVRPARGRVQRISFGRRQAGRGVIRWSGRLRGRRVAGRYRLVLVATSGATVLRSSETVRLRR